jgi:hypothetical protein
MVNAEEFDQITGRLMTTADSISKAKRPAYTVGNADVLHNFKSVAERLGISPGAALAVYMTKHYDAIITALTKPELPQAEEITGRFADAINYLKMGYALLEESKPNVAPAPAWPPAEEMYTSRMQDFKRIFAQQPPTILSGELYDGPNKAPAATPSDRAQTQALGAHMQRARRGEVTLGLADGVLPSPLEGYPLTGAVSPGGQGNAGFEASAGCSTQSSTGQYRDINVLLFELPQDTSPL